eukprot:5533507-Prymnesium_polylepis.1
MLSHRGRRPSPHAVPGSLTHASLASRRAHQFLALAARARLLLPPNAPADGAAERPRTTDGL